MTDRSHYYKDRILKYLSVYDNYRYEEIISDELHYENKGSSVISTNLQARAIKRRINRRIERGLIERRPNGYLRLTQKGKRELYRGEKQN